MKNNDILLESIENEFDDILIDENITDNLKMYLTEIRKHPLLTYEEEKELGKILKYKNELTIIKYTNNYQTGLDFEKVFEMLKYVENKKEIYEMINYILNVTKNNGQRVIFENYIKNNSVEIGNKKIEYELLEQLKKYIMYLDAREKMINSNLRLVISIAKKYYYSNIDLLDLIQEGNIGLMIAIHKFDCDKNAKLSTYATYWINQSISRYIKTSKLLKAGSNNIDEFVSFKNQVKELEDKTGKTYSLSELSKLFDIDYDKVVGFINLQHSEVSLDSTVGDDEDCFLGDFIANDNVDVEADALKQCLSDEIIQLLDCLTEREKMIVLLRFGINTEDKSYTLKEIGKMFNVTSVAIRISEKRALSKLRTQIKSNEFAKSLKLYLN